MLCIKNLTRTDHLTLDKRKKIDYDPSKGSFDMLSEIRVDSREHLGGLFLTFD